MKQANERLATDFTTSQERIQKLQEELASSKASKVRRCINLNDIRYMRDFSESYEDEPENDEEPEGEEPLNNEENDQLVLVRNLFRDCMWTELSSSVLGCPSPFSVISNLSLIKSTNVKRRMKARNYATWPSP